MCKGARARAETEIAAERARVEHEGWGARLLALEDADGLWAGGACFPASYAFTESEQPWTATMHTLQTLQLFGLDPGCGSARRAIGPGSERTLGRAEHLCVDLAQLLHQSGDAARGDGLGEIRAL